MRASAVAGGAGRRAMKATRASAARTRTETMMVLSFIVIERGNSELWIVEDCGGSCWSAERLRRKSGETINLSLPSRPGKPQAEETDEQRSDEEIGDEQFG